MRDPWYVDLVEGFQSVMQSKGMRVLLGNGRSDVHTDESLTDAFPGLRVEGLCLVGTLPISESAVDAARSVPSVVAGGRDVQLANVDVVVNDDFHGATLAVEHLIELGHRQIAHLSFAEGSVAGNRLAGYEAAMRRHGLAGEIRVEQRDFTEQAGYAATLRLLTSPKPPTAIFALDDISCVGALSAADECEVAVPGELSLVGYDNTYLAAIRRLALTTVDPSSSEIGRMAGEALLDRINSPNRPARQLLIEPHLVIRRSTGKPGATRPNASPGPAASG